MLVKRVVLLDLILAELALCLFRRQPHRADGWMTEDYGRYDLCIDSGRRLTAEQAVGEFSAGCNGNRCEVPAFGCVTNGVYAWCCGVLKRVDLDVAAGCHRYLRLFQTQRGRGWCATRRPNQAIVTGAVFVVVGSYLEFAALQAIDALDLGVRLELQALLGKVRQSSVRSSVSK